MAIRRNRGGEGSERNQRTGQVPRQKQRPQQRRRQREAAPSDMLRSEAAQPSLRIPQDAASPARQRPQQQRSRKQRPQQKQAAPSDMLRSEAPQPSLRMPQDAASPARQRPQQRRPAQSARGNHPTSRTPARTQRQANQSRAASRNAAFTATRGGKRPQQKQAASSDMLRSEAAQSSRRLPQEAPPTAQPDQQAEYTSKSVGELRRADRAKRLRKSTRRYMVRVIAIIVVVAALVVGTVGVYNSDLFKIENVTVNGVEHLTTAEMTQLANVPTDTTLLRVDIDTIADRLKHSAWVQDVQINRIFPNTLELNVTERPVAAIVEIPVNNKATVKQWAIARDYTWLMPIPDPSSDAAKTTSQKIYEDAETVLHITDLPYGTSAEIGEICNDANVNNALDIITGMTTDLAGRVVEVSAAGTAETTLILDNGVEVAFGKAEDIRDKERVVLEILNQNPDNVSYINVRMVESPTWRAI